MVLNNREMIIHVKLNCLQSYYKYGGDKLTTIIIVTSSFLRIQL